MTITTQSIERTSFCMTRPGQEAVTSVLHVLGFDLVFEMAPIRYPQYTQLPSLPAQYHYRDEHGTEVMYLAGCDTPMDEERFPNHASRFWITPGADLATYQRVAQALATRWSLTWQDSQAFRDAA